MDLAARVGIMTMMITAAQVVTTVMAVVSPGIVATVCLPEAMMEKTLGVLRGRLTAPTARRQTARVRGFAINAAPR